jgi:Protein tyrosine and serine/threonine kinase
MADSAQGSAALERCKASPDACFFLWLFALTLCIFDRALAGTSPPEEFARVARETLPELNSTGERDSACHLSAVALSFFDLPVVPFNEGTLSEEKRRPIHVTLSYKTLKKRFAGLARSQKPVYFEVACSKRPQTELFVSQAVGALKPGKSVDLTFGVEAYCTTSLRQLAVVSIWQSKPPTEQTPARRGLVPLRPLNRHDSPDGRLGELFIEVRVQSLHSNQVDWMDVDLSARGRETWEEIPYQDELCGTAFKATLLDSDVAVRFMSTRNITNEQVSALLSNSLHMAQLSCPSLLQVVGNTVLPSDQPVVVLTESLPSTSLANLLSEPEVLTSDKLQILHKAAAGLAYLHARELCHCKCVPVELSGFALPPIPNPLCFFCPLHPHSPLLVHL